MALLQAQYCICCHSSHAPPHCVTCPGLFGAYYVTIRYVLIPLLAPYFIELQSIGSCRGTVNNCRAATPFEHQLHNITHNSPTESTSIANSDHTNPTCSPIELHAGMAGMAPAFTETAFIEEVQQPQRPPEPLSSASELAAARAYDHFHPAMPRSSSVASSDSDRPASGGMLEGYASPPAHTCFQLIADRSCNTTLTRTGAKSAARTLHTMQCATMYMHTHAVHNTTRVVQVHCVVPKPPKPHKAGKAPLRHLRHPLECHC